MAEAVGARLGVGGVAHAVHAVEEEGEGPFAVCGALDVDEPFVAEGGGEAALDVLPTADSAVVHPH